MSEEKNIIEIIEKNVLTMYLEWMKIENGKIMRANEERNGILSRFKELLFKDLPDKYSDEDISPELKEKWLKQLSDEMDKVRVEKIEKNRQEKK